MVVCGAFKSLKEAGHSSRRGAETYTRIGRGKFSRKAGVCSVKMGRGVQRLLSGALVFCRKVECSSEGVCKKRWLVGGTPVMGAVVRGVKTKCLKCVIWTGDEASSCCAAACSVCSGG